MGIGGRGCKSGSGTQYSQGSLKGELIVLERQWEIIVYCNFSCPRCASWESSGSFLFVWNLCQPCKPTCSNPSLASFGWHSMKACASWTSASNTLDCSPVTWLVKKSQGWVIGGQCHQCQHHILGYRVFRVKSACCSSCYKCAHKVMKLIMSIFINKINTFINSMQYIISQFEEHFCDYSKTETL